LRTAAPRSLTQILCASESHPPKPLQLDGRRAARRNAAGAGAQEGAADARRCRAQRALLAAVGDPRWSSRCGQAAERRARQEKSDQPFVRGWVDMTPPSLSPAQVARASANALRAARGSRLAPGDVPPLLPDLMQCDDGTGALPAAADAAERGADPAERGAAAAAPHDPPADAQAARHPDFQSSV